MARDLVLLRVDQHRPLVPTLHNLENDQAVYPILLSLIPFDLIISRANIRPAPSS